MIFISGTKDFKMENTAVAIGKFDGLHRGHQALIEKICSYPMTSVLLTFDYHPVSWLGGKKQQLIYTSEERRILAAMFGVDILIEYPFTEETARMEAVDFIREVLIGKLGAMHIVVGEDFHFGADRKGNTDLLVGMSLPLGYNAHVCPKVHLDVPKTFLTDSQILTASDVTAASLASKDCAYVDISATLVRKAISEGRIELANEMLGYPYSIIGEVVHGREIGRTIGMPTANLEPEKSKLLPPNGVYVSMVIINHKKYPAVTNVGQNPTVTDYQDRRVETYVRGFDGNLYGRQIQVQLYHFLRPEQKFSGIEALKTQMHKDMDRSYMYLQEKNIVSE